MADAPQSYANHRRWFPLYHFVAAPIVIANVVFASMHAYHQPTRFNMWGVVFAVGIVCLTLTARVMPLTVQDRLIRLEVLMRMQKLLPPALLARTGDLTRRQFVGLRFACDAELVGLVERCLSGELKTDEQVKKQIKVWQPDWLRA